MYKIDKESFPQSLRHVRHQRDDGHTPRPPPIKGTNEKMVNMPANSKKGDFSLSLFTRGEKKIHVDPTDSPIIAWHWSTLL